MNKRILCYSLSLSILLSGSVVAQQLFVYPQKGQPPEQQNRDMNDCHGWAVQTVGYDPAKIAQYQPPPPQPSSSGNQAAGGVLRGALGGAIIGEIAGGDAGTGAAIGGLFGGLRSARQQEQQSSQQEAYNQQQAAQSEQMQANFNRAYAACLEGRGYTVK